MAKRNNKKINRIQAKTSPRFSVKEEPQVNYNTRKPIFSFHYMKYRGAKCLSKCDSNSKGYFSEKLLEISQLTWAEITSAPRQGMGSELIPSGQFKVSLPPICTPEVSLLVFRFSSKGRIAGIRKGDIYYRVVVRQSHDLYF